MSTTYKAQAISNQLLDWFKARLNGSLVATGAFSSTDQNPYILISDGTPAAGEANFVVKTMPIAWPLAQDILGLTAIQYTPHVIQLCTEADPTAGAGADPTTRAQLGLVLGQIYQMGTRVEWYETANGTAPTLSALPSEGGSATLKMSFDPDFYRPLINGQ
jgi:hypothetical protein